MNSPVRAARSLAIAMVLMAGVAACGTSVRPGQERDPGVATRQLKDHSTQSITVQVNDIAGQPMAGVTLVSSLGTEVLSSALSNASGSASLQVTAGSTISGYYQQDTSYVATSLFDVGPGSAPILQISAIAASGSFNVGVSVASSNAVPNVTGGEVVTGGGWADECSANATIGPPVTLAITDSCLQTDGTYSLGGEVSNSSDNVVAYAEIPDLATSSASQIVEIHVEGTQTSVPFQFTNIPEVSDASCGAFIVPSRKGQPLLGGGIEKITVGLTQAGNTQSGTATFPSDVMALADSLQTYTTLYSDFVSCPVSSSCPDGTESTALQELDQETTGTSGVSPDLDALLLVPDSTEFSFAAVGGSPSLTIVDPIGQGESTEGFVTWTDGSGNFHGWYIFAAPPKQSGRRNFQLPPPPPGFGYSAVPITGEAGYYTASYMTALAGNVPSGYLLGANPYYYAPMGGAWSRGLAQHSSSIATPPAAPKAWSWACDVSGPGTAAAHPLLLIATFVGLVIHSRRRSAGADG